MSEYLDKYDRSTNLIQQRVDREDYRHGWKEKRGVKMIEITITVNSEHEKDSILDHLTQGEVNGELDFCFSVYTDWKI